MARQPGAERSEGAPQGRGPKGGAGEPPSPPSASLSSCGLPLPAGRRRQHLRSSHLPISAPTDRAAHGRGRTAPGAWGSAGQAFPRAAEASRPFPAPWSADNGGRTCRGRSKQRGALKPRLRGHDQHHPLRGGQVPADVVVASGPSRRSETPRLSNAQPGVSYRSPRSASAAKPGSQGFLPWPRPRVPRTRPSSAPPARVVSAPAEPLRTADGSTGRQGSLGAASQPGPGARPPRLSPTPRRAGGQTRQRRLLVRTE